MNITTANENKDSPILKKVDDLQKVLSELGARQGFLCDRLLPARNLDSGLQNREPSPGAEDSNASSLLATLGAIEERMAAMIAELNKVINQLEL